MVKSKAWAWEKEENNIWLEPCEESHYFAKKWKNEGRKSLLDLGCGLGRHSILFAKENFKVTAIDLSEYGVNYLREWQKRESVDILTKQCDMLNLPFSDNAFDCIWSYHVISHTDTNGFKRILAEIKRVLKPNGAVYLTLCSKESASFNNSKNIVIDENTIIKSNSTTEKDVPHFYVGLHDILFYFNDFSINRIRHIDDCYFKGRVQSSKHYFIEGVLNKEKTTLDYSHIIGKVVSGKIDRPLGSHHPQYQKLIYSVNYGYVSGVFAPDGEEQDIYLLGVDEPILEFTGEVIAVIHRHNDTEDKWVVAPLGISFSDEEILEKIKFQEKFFDSELYR